MYKVNENVIYPGTGVCRIEDIKTQDFGGEKKEYYVLKPLYEKYSTTLFVPVEGSKVNLRKLFTKNEIDEFIEKIDSFEELVVENDRKRQDAFNKILRSGNNVDIVRVITHLYNEKLEKSIEGKSLRATDEKIFNEAQKLINQEFATTLGILPDEVPEYISKKIKG